MNPQYLPQQDLYYGKQQPNSPYAESNPNLPNKGPPLNQDSATNSVYESNIQHGSPMHQSNQTNFINQMSNISLSGPPKSSNSDGLPQTESNTSFSSSVNGASNQDHHQSQGSNIQRSIHKQHQYQQQQGTLLNNPISKPPLSGTTASTFSTSNPANFCSASGLNLNGPPTTTALQNIPGQQVQQNSTGSSIQQNQAGLPLPGQQKQVGSTLPGQQNQIGLSFPSQQNHAGLSLPGQTKQTGPPLLVQQNQLGPLQPGQLGPPQPGQQNHSGPPLPGQKNQAGPPLPGQQNQLRPLLASQQNQLGPPLPGQQNQFGQPLPGQQNQLGPPLPGQQNQLGPPLLGQQNQLGPPLTGQQNQLRPPLPGQQSQLGPPLPGQQNQWQSQSQYLSTPAQNSTPYGINQGFQQTNYSASQPPQYGNQPNLYRSGMANSPGGYPAQDRKLNPDNIPSAIQVYEDDQRLRGGDFITNQRGLVPPLVTTKFIVRDQGNSSPRFIRSSIYCVPTHSETLKQTQIPFGIILSPMAKVENGEYEPPIVDMGEIGPVRCMRCKAYMCPFMQFVDAGRRFQCAFCKATTEVPTEYFQHLDHTGARMDRYERPELMLGTFEYLATKDYCRNNVLPKPPAIIFVIDVSYNNVKSGLLNLLCSEIKQIIRNFPVDMGQTKSNMKIGFITYDSSIHFYNCKANLAQPQMIYVSDVQDVFMPLLEGFLCDPEESESVIDSLMTQIPVMFAETRQTETILGPAIQAGLEALKASECAGKLIIFQSSLPIGEAPGKLNNRDDRNVLGTDKEKNILSPQTNFYNNLGQDCAGVGCTVDLFLFNNSYIDVATIGQVSRITGGEIYNYSYFQADVDGERLITDIINNISKPIAFDAVMRVRTSTGVRPTDFYGHFYMANTTDIELSGIDCDKAIAVEIKHDDKLAEEDGVYIQAALLYTSCSGIRRLRIINLSLNTSSQIAELYRTCDLDAIINFLLKQSVSKLVELSPRTVKEGLNSKCAAILATYRKHCTPGSSMGQLVLPECMKLLPVYINSLLKSEAISGGAGITVDQKAHIMMTITSMPIPETVAQVYPRLISLHNIDPLNEGLPRPLRCSIDKFEDHGVYLLENGIHMFIWLGLSLDPQWVEAVFGVSSVVQIDTDKFNIPILDNPLNKRIRDIITYLQNERRYCMRLTVTRQREKMEMVMRQFLIEDRGADGSLSYADYLCHMYGEIRSLLT